MRTDTRVAIVVFGILTGVAVGSPHAAATSFPVARSMDARAIATHIRDAAARYNVPERVIHAVIRVESEFNPRAVSPRGAVGLMQLMPTTATLFGARDAFDPAQNIMAGARYLRALLDRFGNNLPLVLAAYNAGENAVLRHGGVPPYPETRAYVARVLALVAGGPGATLTASGLGARRWAVSEGDVAYHSRAVLDTLATGSRKERVLDVLATEWRHATGKVVKVEGVRIRVSRRSAARTLVEAGDVTLLDARAKPALHWLLFEDERLVATGHADEWPKAVARYALDLGYAPGGLPPL